MPLIPVPIYGVRVSANPSKWLFDIIGGRHERNYEEFSVAGFIFTYFQKYFSGSLTGGSPPSPLPTPMDPPLVVTCAERLNRMRCRWRQTRVRPSSQFLSATWRIRQNDLCGGGDRVVAAVTVASCYAPAEQEIGSIDR